MAEVHRSLAVTAEVVRMDVVFEVLVVRRLRIVVERAGAAVAGFLSSHRLGSIRMRCMVLDLDHVVGLLVSYKPMSLVLED